MLRWIDNDACSKDVRKVIYRAAKRLAIPVNAIVSAFALMPETPMNPGITSTAKGK